MKMLPMMSLVLAGLWTTNTFASCNNLLDYSHQKLRSEEQVNLCDSYEGEVLLVVNTASKCGFTPQFEQLEALYQKYKDQGLVVLGFPSDNFFQEHNDSGETAKVCYVNYGVTFPMFETSSVRGGDANALFAELQNQSDLSVKWNFYKYLVGRDGQVIEGYNSKQEPMGGDIEAAIVEAL
ncbi:Hydroperoxy fatty acid reductase gpx1 [Sinobacterium norvegicum]|uniref:Glutathione peroxidase n=1 Tax=Sinobacterium norvegicum TaxID=1641715 RepID=A0ABM9AI26_9GAMM|nr:glutathione peroxidase [Sinobacterium norvegicum]CAH0992785.1 Hydroperoxy fatty acid reductase gpx1 [Sinobacterium norvegicum]